MSACGFSALCAALPRRLVGDRLVGLIGRAFVRGSAQCLACGGVCFLLLMCIMIAIYGRVKGSVMSLFVFWVAFLLGLGLEFVGGLLVFRWGLVVLLLLRVCFFFVVARGFRGVSLSWESG